MDNSERKSDGKKTFRIQKWQITKALVSVYDVITIIISYFAALWIRFDCRYGAIPLEYLQSYQKSILIYALFCLLVYGWMHLYRTVWRFASYDELVRSVIANAVTLIINVGMTILFFKRMPITYYAFGIVIQFCFCVLIRFSYRFYLLEASRRNESDKLPKKRIMIVGAGMAGQMILRDIYQTRGNDEKVYAFIDDDVNKWNRYIDGIKVYGGREEILKTASDLRIEKIYVAIPSAGHENIRDILNVCKETGCELKNLPAIMQFRTGEITVNKMKDVAVEDLLGRDTIQVNMEEIYQYIQGKIVLITGGGGSIGSELCRQVAAHNPKQLIIFDVYENNAYEIQQELRKKYPYLNLVTLIGSVRDSRRINQVFAEYRPDIVYHAAAHKHVPLMEDSPCEAIKNNAIGTYKTAYAAMCHGCKKFVLISTDKAVNPTNVMGASKRICEMVVQSFDAMIKEGRAGEIPRLFAHHEDEDGEMSEMKLITQTPATEFVAVRFGNVLGSNGSVIPLFKKQITEGGPVTVTHPDIIRYFMTIPEAVSLVMQAGVYAKGGEIFVLDMGEPVKIDTLARNLIKLSGYKPDVDIKISYTGLRPGEKLFEEKLMAEEGMKKTENQLIHIGCPIPFDTEVFLKQMKKVMKISYRNDPNIRKMISDIVTTYKTE